MKRIVTGLTLVAVALLLSAGACQSESDKKAQKAREDKQNSIIECGETGQSLECLNLSKKRARYDKPSKISYIYLLSDVGTIYTYYTVKGKVSSNKSQMAPEDLVARKCFAGDCGEHVVEAPGDDGAYGPNEDGNFFFTSDDVLVTFNTKYILSDAPMSIRHGDLLMEYKEGSKPTP